MSLGMFVVGGLVFSVYAGMALVITVFGKDRNQQEYLDMYKDREFDSIDYDGIGNQGRIPYSRRKTRLSSKKSDIYFKKKV